MRHMVPFYKRTAFPRGWEWWFWWPCCTGEIGVSRPARVGNSPWALWQGRLGCSIAQKVPHTHHGGSASVGLALFRVLVWFNPQPHCHGSEEASGATAPSVAAAACPGQGPAPPEGFVPLGMGVGQALALWRLQLLWLQPPELPGKVVCKAWCAEPQLGNVLLPWRSLCLSIMSSCTHTLLSYLSGENSFTYDLAARKGMGQLPFA